MHLGSQREGAVKPLGALCSFCRVAPHTQQPGARACRGVCVHACAVHIGRFEHSEEGRCLLLVLCHS